METKHTQGKWTVRKTKNRTIEIKSDGIVLICEIDISNETNNPTPIGANANAKLIAAAPDLLKACIQALRFVDVEETAFCDLELAIKKATE